MNKKGFTLVELLAAVVILGIITALSFPLLRRFTENSENRRFDIYEDSLKNSAKVYVDAYETDLFGYDVDGDVPSDKVACVDVDMLEQKKIFKDINYENYSCKTNNTFIKVYKKYKLVDSTHNTYNSYYEYEVYLGCGVVSADSDTIADISVIRSPDNNLHNVVDECSEE